MKQHPTFNLTYDDSSMTAKWPHHHHHPHVHRNFVPSNRHRWNYSIGTGVENTIITVAPPALMPLSQLTGTMAAATGYLDTNGDNGCVAVANQLCMCNLCNANTFVTPSSSSMSSKASAMSSTSTPPSSHTSTMHKPMIQLNHNSYSMTAAAAAAAASAAATSTGHFSYSTPNPNFMFPAPTASTADFVVDNASSVSSNGATQCYHTADHANVFSKQGWWSSHSFHSRLSLLLLLLFFLFFFIFLHLIDVANFSLSVFPFSVRFLYSICLSSTPI